MQKSTCKGLCNETLQTLPTQPKPQSLGLWQRLIVQHAYPPKLILDSLGLMWGLHFIWEHLWIQAAVSMVGFALTGTFLARNTNKETLAKSLLGQFFLALIHPSTFTLQVVGYAFLFFGVGIRSSFYALIGVTLFSLASAAAWKRVFQSPPH